MNQRDSKGGIAFKDNNNCVFLCEMGLCCLTLSSEFCFLAYTNKLENKNVVLIHFEDSALWFRKILNYFDWILCNVKVLLQHKVSFSWYKKWMTEDVENYT